MKDTTEDSGPHKSCLTPSQDVELDGVEATAVDFNCDLISNEVDEHLSIIANFMVVRPGAETVGRGRTNG